MIYKIGFLIHMIGILLIAGGAIGTVITESLFWKNVRAGKGGLKGISPLFLRFPPVIIIGALLMLVSGLLMLYGLNWGYWGQTWLYIKLTLFIALILNGRLNAAPIFAKINAEAQSERPDEARLLILKKKINLFHTIQFTMLFLILVLVIFKL